MSGGVGLCWPWNRPGLVGEASAGTGWDYRGTALILLRDDLHVLAQRAGYEFHAVHAKYEHCAARARCQVWFTRGGSHLRATFAVDEWPPGGPDRQQAGECFRHYLALADRYLAAGACRAMIRDRFSGLVEL